MADQMMPSGGAKKTGAPACSAEYSPGSGGYDGAAIEGGGEAGDKGVGVEAEFTKPTEEGDYNHAKVAAFGDYPHSGPNPDNLTGPPLGSTDGGPNHSNY